MKVLVTADLHYNLKQYDWLLQQAPNYDGVIIAGDLLDLAATVDRGTQSLVVEKYLRRMRTTGRVVVSSGNHDIDEEAETSGEAYPAAWIRNLKFDQMEGDGDYFEWNGLRVSVCPWWMSDKQRETAYQALKAQAGKDGLWIWIHHAPPDQQPVSWTGKAFKGEPVVNDWIIEFQPDLVLSGHIHHAPFTSEGSWNVKMGRTWIFNAGRELGSVPAHLRIDLEARRVDWCSSAGGESLTY